MRSFIHQCAREWAWQEPSLWDYFFAGVMTTFMILAAGVVTFLVCALVVVTKGLILLFFLPAFLFVYVGSLGGRG